MNKPRKQSMRQTIDEHSPTYRRAAEAVRERIENPLKPIEKPVFVRGALVRPK